MVCSLGLGVQHNYELQHNKIFHTLYLSEIGILRGPSIDRDSDGSSSIYSKKALPLQHKLRSYLKHSQ